MKNLIKNILAYIGVGLTLAIGIFLIIRIWYILIPVAIFIGFVVFMLWSFERVSNSYEDWKTKRNINKMIKKVWEERGEK